MKRRAKNTDRGDDADAFLRAMADVVPLPPDPRGRITERPPAVRSDTERVTPSGRAAGSDEPDGDFAAPGTDRREIRKLKRAEYPVTARRDLHGLKATEAAAEVRRFLDSSRHNGHRCICIIHGRGVHSADNVSVLKTTVRKLLRGHRSVLAYSDAPRSGGGAVYVLLRK